MKIRDVNEYLSAVAERQHLERIIERGRREFSGYGLELFERGLRKKIAPLDDAIAQWDVRSGYNQNACNWSGPEKIQVLKCEVRSRSILDTSVLANSSNCITISNNVQMLQGSVNMFDGVRLNVDPARICISVVGELTPVDSGDIVGLAPGIFLSDQEKDSRRGCYLPA